MSVFKITQSRIGENQFRITLEFGALNASCDVEFVLSDEQQSRLRWYLEDFLKKPHPPADERAKAIEADMKAIGKNLFDKVIEGNRTTQKIWDRIFDDAKDVRVEVRTGVEAATAIPWELLQDPETDRYLALEAQSFVRGQSDTTYIPLNYQPEAGNQVRILLVICRPSGRRRRLFRRPDYYPKETKLTL